MASCAAWFGWRPIDPYTQHLINKNDAIGNNVRFFMELAEKLPGCLREAGFNVIGDPCYYGVNLLISSKKYPNLIARIDMTDMNRTPDLIEFVYYVNDNLSASFTISLIDFFDLIGYYKNKEHRFYTPETFERNIRFTIKELGVDYIPYKFKYLSDTYEYDFDKDDINFEILPEIKWCYFQDGELKIEDMKLSMLQYYGLKLFTGN
jgi:hypothetical protein